MSNGNVAASPLFSLLICTVGKEELTRGAIQSILDQNFQDFEIVVTNTSGSSHIRDLAASFSDQRIKYFDVPNRDPSISWQFAYEKSTGQFILWYDDDNRLAPWVLSHCRNIITSTGADIVSGNHAYYFGAGNRHFPEKNNYLSALLPFSGNIRVHDPQAMVRAVYAMNMGHAGIPRWHSAATFISRSICEHATRDIGYVVAPYMLGNFSSHPVTFHYSKKPIYDDRPWCIIGKFGNSITQQWSNSFVQESRPSVHPYQFTSVSCRTLGNTTAECHLKVQHDIPSLSQYPFAWNKFYIRYSSELIFIDLPLRKRIGAWRELWSALKNIPERDRGTIRMLVLRRFVLSILVHALKKLELWEFIRIKFKRAQLKSERRQMVDLTSLNIHSIDEAALKLDDVFLRAWKTNIHPPQSITISP